MYDDAAAAAAAEEEDDDRRPAAKQTGKSKKIAATESDGQGGESGGLYLINSRHDDKQTLVLK